ncbi:hypothetical protein KIW84_074856 [Lathyrus oleraceus]|uniref:Uncharacterized protein n=1 Tax=Pisum sativum TaxID=3888 RepID=A0A9D4ZXD9_PEA|nr:hypothetical protein KIW84_074856 [Pisum sativum]
MASFWSDVVYTLKVIAPLVDVIRMVDNERKPAMGYIYAAMGVAKESIEKAFNSNSSKYKAVFDIIDKRWECQLHHPLHSAGYYLNPEYYYEKPEIENGPKLVRGLRKCIETLSESDEVEDKISVQLAQYKGATGLFGIRVVIRQRMTLAPTEWSKSYGAEIPDLQLLVVKMLSLVCSAFGCKQMGEMREDGEPLQEDLVHEDDDLTWAQVTKVSGVNEPVIYTRRSRLLEDASTSRAQQVVVEDVEEDDENEELEEYFDDI